MASYKYGYFIAKIAPDDTGVIRLRNVPWCSGVTGDEN
jgi:hypothetical protein